LEAFKSKHAHMSGNIESGLTVDKDIVIRLARQVDSQVLGNALKDSLQPRVSASSLPAVDMLQVAHPACRFSLIESAAESHCRRRRRLQPSVQQGQPGE
jgi:hypothetical protein